MADIPTVAMKEENGYPGLFRRDKPPGNPNTIFRSEVYVLIIKGYVLWRGLNLPKRTKKNRMARRKRVFMAYSLLMDQRYRLESITFNF
jgi:hypothetical protein